MPLSKLPVSRAFARTATCILVAASFATAPCFLSGCGGSSSPVRSPTPAAMHGLDVHIEPHVSLSGEGARQHSNFGNALVGAMEAHLVGDGFDVVPDSQGTALLRVQARANLDISRSQFLMVNGKPLESSSALIQIRVVYADGSLIDAFDIAGDADADTAAVVAANLVERLKSSRRVMAIARAPQRKPSQQVAAEETQRTASLARHESDAAAAETERKRRLKESAIAIRRAANAVRLEEDAESAAVVGFPQNNAYAVVIGVEKYRNLPAPPGAASDARRFKALLTGTLKVPEHQIRLAVDSDATRTDLEKHLKWLKENVPERGRIYFFFAGHGAPEPTKKTTFLMPFEGDANDLPGSALSMADLVKSLSETKAEHVLAVVDACFTGDGGNTTRSVIAPGLRALTYKSVLPVASKVALFTASAADQASGDLEGSGAFTSELTEGLSSGGADLDGDGSITLEELRTYVEPRVRRKAKMRHNREQTPTLSLPAGIDPKNFLVVWGLPSK